jgi:hypothetical protein
MHRKLALLSAIAFALCLSARTPMAHAWGDGTPDTDPPAEETVCNGLGGRMWGLCVAYCEAQDCPGSEHPSCEVLRRKLSDITGSPMFPCDGIGIN